MTAVDHQDLVGVAVEAGRFATLAAALRSSGLDSVLHGAGPFTLFAPTDAAFARLAPQQREALLAPEGGDRLRAVLAHHVVPGMATAADLTTRRVLTTLAGGTLTVSTSRSGIAVGGADVVTTDLDASNGLIHVIDRVLLP